MKYDIIIIGAGCAGLMAMHELLQQGYRVCLIEAATVAGGRISTLKEKGFEKPVETGAEFIHGRLPLTLKLLRKANIEYHAIGGKRVSVINGKWIEEEYTKHWDELLRKLRRQKTDTSIRAFLEEHFSEPAYKMLRTAAQGFAEGFDLADIDKASVLAVEKEWRHEDQKQFRIPGGYMQLVDLLLSQCLALKGEIVFDCCADTIEYSKGRTTVITKNRKKLESTRTIITTSIGVLQSGAIQFKPGLGIHAEAIRQVGFGPVIKFLLQFKYPFWRDKRNDIGFLLSNANIPTWWTQAPGKSNLLTGWQGGPAAARLSQNDEETLLRKSLQSLSSIFQISYPALKKELVHYRICNWQHNPFIQGGYSYNTLFTEKAIEILSQPVAGSIFFAGEAIYQGESQGTVEAALQSGREVAKKIRKLDG